MSKIIKLHHKKFNRLNEQEKVYKVQVKALHAKASWLSLDAKADAASYRFDFIDSADALIYLKPQEDEVLISRLKLRLKFCEAMIHEAENRSISELSFGLINNDMWDFEEFELHNTITRVEESLKDAEAWAIEANKAKSISKKYIAHMKKEPNISEEALLSQEALLRAQSHKAYAHEKAVDANKRVKILEEFLKNLNLRKHALKEVCDA